MRPHTGLEENFGENDLTRRRGDAEKVRLPGTAPSRSRLGSESPFRSELARVSKRVSG